MVSAIEETMITTISILTSFIFAAVYPLGFWISCKDPLKNRFHEFQIGLPCFVAGVAVAASWFFSPLTMTTKLAAVVWLTVFLGVSWYVYPKEFPSPVLMTIPSLLGVIVFAMAQNELVAARPDFIVAGVLGGLVFTAAIFTMNLGHWYLNVHGLPMSHLLRAVYVYGFLLGLRIVWDVYFLLRGTVLYQGDGIPVYRFVAGLEGFLLCIALFFGTLFPAFALYLVRETLKVKSTQSATGILYVILIGVFIGDMTYKYYLIKYGIAL